MTFAPGAGPAFTLVEEAMIGNKAGRAAGEIKSFWVRGPMDLYRGVKTMTYGSPVGQGQKKGQTLGCAICQKISPDVLDSLIAEQEVWF